MRAAGIVLAVSSLPSPYGIGTLGQAAFSFVDFLKQAGIRYWQLLPLGPTGYGDSPYQSFSSFAGNPYYIDLDLLRKAGLLKKEEIKEADFGDNPERVDYGKLFENRLPLLKKAFDRAPESLREKAAIFRQQQAPWLEDYALFMALKTHFGGGPWTEWPQALRLREGDALARYRVLLKEEIDFHVFLQYLFFDQWEALKQYAHEKGLRFIGDLPIYVALDSADVWRDPLFFELDEEAQPLSVAGVPPDYFSEDGQLWGNPLYRWDRMKEDGFGWWIRRVEGAGRLFDVIRIDHFRGFDTYWAVPYPSKTARNGSWRRGPGMELVRVLNNWFPQLDFIAEDLGTPAESVTRLLQDSGWPGMRVLAFAFGGEGDNPHLPHMQHQNCICYTTTHDNIPLAGWVKDISSSEKKRIMDYLFLESDRLIVPGILRAGLRSVAKIFAAPMQDYLELDEEAVMNRPGTLGGNWQWRLRPKEASPQLARRLRKMMKIYHRLESSD